MTEQEYLASVDPVAMLDWLNSPASLNGKPWSEWKPSDRKLRLVCAACAEGMPDVREAACYFADGEVGKANKIVPVQESWWATMADVSNGVRQAVEMSGSKAAHILRDIIGNPFRSVTLPLGDRDAVCPVCVGFKGHIRIVDKQACPPPSPACAMSREDYQLGSLDAWRKETATRWATCPECKGIGTGHGPSPVLTPTVLALAQAAYDERLPDGTLDDATLAILADALEDVGLPGEVECDHVAENPRRRPGGQTLPACHRCPNGIQPHPILAALRSPGPHYPGFWALDVVLGRS